MQKKLKRSGIQFLQHGRQGDHADEQVEVDVRHHQAVGQQERAVPGVPVRPQRGWKKLIK